MDWEAKEKERKDNEAKERLRLMALTDGEAESLPVPDRYQRIRYLREVEAAEWLASERRKQSFAKPVVDDQPKRKYTKSNVTHFKSWQD